MTRLIALIPARAGSKRVAHKNTRILNGHPLFAYAIATAQEAGIFNAIVVSSDDQETLVLAERYGAQGLERPSLYAADNSPDIQWVRQAFYELGHYNAFAILRPTSPFRRGDWVKAAWQRFRSLSDADSLRAMRPVTEHPGKMWRLGPSKALPLFPFSESIMPRGDIHQYDACFVTEPQWHSTPTQLLPELWIQTAALEIAWTHVLYNDPPSIAGEVVMPLRCEADAPEAFDINTPDDWDRAVAMAAAHPEWLPVVKERVAA